MVVAAALQHLRCHPDLQNRTAVIVCCGGNISPERFRDAEQLAQSLPRSIRDKACTTASAVHISDAAPRSHRC